MRTTFLNTIRTGCGETLARRMMIPILMIFLALILSSCASVAPQRDKPTLLAIPTVWSSAADAPSSQPSSLGQW
ncbi:MAG: hypothetical protein COW48_01340 [Hydrogenophilales bacterium CG17_big_fil_post_rev_8_21_14_2_50_63_12]|nr:MAG: hypothetical protein COW48_01340 [Hydrogenophilales bacterium CG17_big_fil_post_rev_8_21_14_2_50_63_12]PIX98182.1 MAG: hypothetical protein COZ24_01430 [Hydrogenophilales bacterium CG_4_10_14_3_um_filter_63_21]PJB03493.1 MAG: hypothetical protein CO126_06515 [Hydrogenophilales bacterium CG_4_9_14_3_um_filter_63_34]